MLQHLIKVEPVTAEAIAPFGALIGPRAPVRPMNLDYYLGKVATGRQVEFKSDTPVELSLARIDRRPLEVRYLERHPGHTQTFLPLGNQPFLAIFAPPSESDLPDLDALRAFRFEGDTGITLHRGTWHEFPFAIEDNTHIVVMLSSQTTRDLQQRAPNGIEAFGPDLDKKDINTRFGVTIALQE
ncbi:MAG: ureidoglycolate hydrolase [Gammaproteobacteria bacterium]|nr:ureidoglycolate hydrolase [Gammaproteobacteria bacterium]